MSLTTYPKMEQREFGDIDREEWRPIPSLDGYEVSSHGRVRSYRRQGGTGSGRLAQPKPKATFVSSSTGYLCVTLQRSPGRSQAYPVHVLVALAFLGPRPEGQQVAHADGDRANASLSNLRYTTARENARDKVVHGTAPVGEQNPRHKLSARDVGEIRSRRRSGELQRQIAADFAISQQLVSRICAGGCWSHLVKGAAS